MYRIYHWSICLIFLLSSLLLSESLAGPPGGGGGRGGGGGMGGGGGGPVGGFGGGGMGGAFHVGGGNTPNHGNVPYNGGGFPGGGPGPYYHGGVFPGGWHGGPGPYYGGWPGFHWGITIPFGYDDYDWYAPYYYRYYYYEPTYYYSGAEYYSVESPASSAQYPQTGVASTAQYPQNMSTPPIPTVAQAARLTDEQLRMMITVALGNYIKDLDMFTSGESWKKHFKLAELKARLSALQNEPPDAATRTLVTDISQKFEAAAKDPTYETITKPWSFQTLLVGLKEYSLSPVQRQNHTLYAKAETLKRSLDNVSTGGDWKVYLQINELEKLLVQPPIYNEDMDKNLEKILVRFDNVAQNAEYKAIADLQGFDVTRTGLQQYVLALRADPARGGTLIPSPPPPAESSSGKATL